MREAEAAQGQAGKVTTHLPGGPTLAYLSPSAQLHYCHCLFNTHGLGSSKAPDPQNKGRNRRLGCAYDAPTLQKLALPDPTPTAR